MQNNQLPSLQKKGFLLPIIFAWFVHSFLTTTAFSQKTKTEAFPIVTKYAKATIVYDRSGPLLDSIAAHLLATDIENVTDVKPLVLTNLSEANGPVIVIGNVQSKLVQSFLPKNSLANSKLAGRWESFAFLNQKQPFPAITNAFIIAGSDARGTAYGVFSLSEKIGVSPWYWWADAHPKKQKELAITQADFVSPPPAVKYRGIFINDEDWGLQPWAAKTFEPETGDIGPKTYAKVFELLLRLKANLIWPAMHESTKAFFHYPGNAKTAQDYQIVIGSSHAEPMLRNNVSEWNEKTNGRFNFLTNRKNILQYWEERVKETRDLNAMYSLGIRGVHDSQMEGVKNLKEAVPVVEQVIADERELLANYINKDVTLIPQVLTPYKEVLEIYDHGLTVPDDVTLVWPDDNYGYIARLNSEKEKQRKGSSGVYYHASYWGRPHDYLWLPSTHPSLMREEMIKAYQTGADRLWVLNVGDIKPQEYNLQQFLDMAYNPVPFANSRYTQVHMQRWLSSIFGKEAGQAIFPLLWEYYQLAFERRPEFMGWSQTEPTTTTNHTHYNHFYFGDEAQKRMEKYSGLETAVRNIQKKIDSKDADAFYQLLYYPLTMASMSNKKFLYRDKALYYSRQNRISAFDYARFSKNAYDSIVTETTNYNTKLSGGKWNKIMSMNPRNLPVFQPPVIPSITIDSTNTWLIAPEGFVTKDSSLLVPKNSLQLPSFDNLNRQRYFVDVFICRQQPMEWRAETSGSWIVLSNSSGTLQPAAGVNETRIWVSIDWSKAPKGNTKGVIRFFGPDKMVELIVQANHLSATAHGGFIENNGFVVMQAAHFTRLINQPFQQWKTIHGLGYTGQVLQAYPFFSKRPSSVNTDSIRNNNAFIDYDFYSFSPAKPVITIFALPTHPINKNYSVRYAVSIDNGPITVVDLRTVGRSETWKQNVLRNRSEQKVAAPFLPAGKHTLRIYAVDPGVMLDEIRIDLGGLKNAYSTLPETKVTFQKK